MILERDFNGNVGKRGHGYEYESQEYCERNEDQKWHKAFFCVSTAFTKSEEHLITCKNGGTKSQIEYISGERKKKRVVGCKLIS